jgi:hypothetical protein
MATLVWRAPLSYLSPGDEAAFFSWLGSIAGVVSVQGRGSELHIQLRSKRLSSKSLREFVALYARYHGYMGELAQFETPSNAAWFAAPSAAWHAQVFQGARSA